MFLNIVRDRYKIIIVRIMCVCFLIVNNSIYANNTEDPAYLKYGDEDKDKDKDNKYYYGLLSKEGYTGLFNINSFSSLFFVNGNLQNKVRPTISSQTIYDLDQYQRASDRINGDIKKGLSNYINREIEIIKRLLNITEDDKDILKKLDNLSEEYIQTTNNINELLNNYQIFPIKKVNVEYSEDKDLKKPDFLETEEIKVGFFQMESDIVNQSQILIALRSIENFKLDKVIWVVKEGKLNKYNEIMLKIALDPFGELFEVLNTNSGDKKKNIPILLEMNKHIKFNVLIINEIKEIKEIKEIEEEITSVLENKHRVKEKIEDPFKGLYQIPIGVLKYIIREDSYVLNYKVVKDLKKIINNRINPFEEKYMNKIDNKFSQIIENVSRFINNDILEIKKVFEINEKIKSEMEDRRREYQDVMENIKKYIKYRVIELGKTVNVDSNNKYNVEEDSRIDVKRLQIGIVTIDDNLITHNQILAALKMMVSFKLDKIVWIIQEGESEERQRIIKNILGVFGDLFKIVIISNKFENNEINEVFNILSNNRKQKIDLFYFKDVNYSDDKIQNREKTIIETFKNGLKKE